MGPASRNLVIEGGRSEQWLLEPSGRSALNLPFLAVLRIQAFEQRQLWGLLPCRQGARRNKATSLSPSHGPSYNYPSPRSGILCTLHANHLFCYSSGGGGGPGASDVMFDLG